MEVSRKLKAMAV